MINTVHLSTIITKVSLYSWWQFLPSPTIHQHTGNTGLQSDELSTGHQSHTPFSQASGIIKGREDRKIEKARCSGCLQQNAAFQTYSCTYELTVRKTSTRASQTKHQNGRRRWDQEVRAKGKTAAVQSSWFSSEFKGYAAAHTLGDALCYVHTKANLMCLVGLKSRPNCIGKKKEWGGKGRDCRWRNGGLIEVCYVYVWHFWTIKRREKKKCLPLK